MLRSLALALVAALLLAEPPAAQRLRAGAAVGSQPVSVTLASMPDATAGQVYTTQSVTCGGGTGPYTVTLLSGTPPTGLALQGGTAAPRDFGGTPSTVGVYTFTLRCTDSLAATGDRLYEIEITDDLPTPWQRTSVGTQPTAGGECLEDGAGEWTITGSGDVDGTSDEFQFCYQVVSGNIEIVATITMLTTTAAFGDEAGVMVRASLDSDAATLFCPITSDSAIVEFRTTTAGAMGSDDGPDMTTGTVRIRVVDDVAVCAADADAVEPFTQVGIAQALPLPAFYQVGLAVNANNFYVGGPALTTAVMTDVSVMPFDPPDLSDFGGGRPHWQGPGATTAGGRGGGSRVCTVNTLTISGGPTWGSSGDIRDCLAGVPAGCDVEAPTVADCARFVIFSVSGVSGSIGTVVDIPITAAYITVAWSTAPTCSEGSPVGGQGCGNGPGGFVCVNCNVTYETHNIIQLHAAFWVSDHTTGSPHFSMPLGGSPDANVHNLVFDHLTALWARNNYPVLFAGPETGGEVLIVDSLIGEPSFFGGSGGSVGIGLDQGPNNSNTVARSVLANVWGRPPATAIPGRHLIYNNLAYNPVQPADDGALAYGFYSWNDRNDNPGATGGGTIAYLNNWWIAGPDSGTPSDTFHFSTDAANFANGTYAYLTGNTGPGITGCTGDGQWNGVATGSGWATSVTPSYVNVLTAGPDNEARVDTITDPEGPLFWAGALNLQLIPAATCTGSGPTAMRDAILANAGARPTDRDAATIRILGDVTDGGGCNDCSFQSYLDTHHGGVLPPIATRSRTCTPPSSPNGAGVRTLTGGATSTRFEDWIYGVDPHDGSTGCGADRLENPWTP